MLQDVMKSNQELLLTGPSVAVAPALLVEWKPPVAVVSDTAQLGRVETPATSLSSESIRMTRGD